MQIGVRMQLQTGVHLVPVRHTQKQGPLKFGQKSQGNQAAKGPDKANVARSPHNPMGQNKLLSTMSNMPQDDPATSTTVDISAWIIPKCAERADGEEFLSSRARGRTLTLYSGSTTPVRHPLLPSNLVAIS